MKNKSNLHYRRQRAKLERLMNDPEKFISLIGTEITEKDVALVHEIARDARIDDLIESLNIDKNQFQKARKKVIKLSPNSTECHMLSALFRDYDGKYLVEDLLYEYHDSILREGVMLERHTATSFLLKIFRIIVLAKNDIMNMGKKKIDEYCNEVRDEI